MKVLNCFMLTNEGQIGTEQGNKQSKTARGIARCISWINEVDKDISSVEVRGQVHQRDESSGESKTVNDHNEAITCQPNMQIKTLSRALTLQSLATISSQEYLQKITTKRAACMSSVPCHLDVV
jgi:hypothetical protein